MADISHPDHCPNCATLYKDSKFHEKHYPNKNRAKNLKNLSRSFRMGASLYQNPMLALVSVGLSTFAASSEVPKCAINKAGVKFYSHGCHSYREKEYEVALENFDMSFECCPALLKSLYNKACCYALLSEATLSITALKQVIELQPKYRKRAMCDKDFYNIRGNRNFQALID